MTMLVAALALVADTTASYPIPPQPLRWLYRDAELVVVAKAGETKDLEKGDGFYSAQVVLSVQKVLKGKCDGTEVTVVYCPGMVCPAPDRYPPGKPLLVFLTRHEKLKAWRANGLSYGSKELEESSLAVYIQRLEELAKIPEEKPDEEPSRKTLDWLVLCIEHPATRWEGAYEFHEGGRRGGKERAGIPIPAERLAKEQMKRVVESLVTSKHFSYGDIYVVGMLKDVADPRIETYLATELRVEYSRGTIHWSDWLMTALARRLQLQGAQDLITKFENSRDDGVRHAQIGKFLELVEQK